MFNSRGRGTSQPHVYQRLHSRLDDSEVVEIENEEVAPTLLAHNTINGRLQPDQLYISSTWARSHVTRSTTLVLWEEELFTLIYVDRVLQTTRTHSKKYTPR